MRVARGLLFASIDSVKKAFAITILLSVFPVTELWAADYCEVCGDGLTDTVYMVMDQVAGVRKRVCHKCVELPERCYLCGMPAVKDVKELPDGRILCARDVKSVVLDEDEAQRIWTDVKDSVERQFSRFTTFPDNVTVQPLDRVDLQQIFKFAGNDAVCPNVWGCTLPVTNDDGHVTYKISLLRGLPGSVLRATCAHELTHTWAVANVAPARKQRMDQDAVEGFCELVSYLYTEARNDTVQLGIIKSNAYTRGQFTLFLEAERRFGFNDVAEWMKFGVDARLTGADLERVRKVAMPAPSAAPTATKAEVAHPVPQPAAPPAPETLTLKGIMWSKTRPMALINNHTFQLNEESKVRLGSSNVTVRCVAIQPDSVVIHVAGSSEQQTLRLK